MAEGLALGILWPCFISGHSICLTHSLTSSRVKSLFPLGVPLSLSLSVFLFLSS